MSSRVRQATQADLGALAPLFDAYRVFYGQSSDLPRAQSFLQARFANRESVVLVAEGASELVGFVQLYPTFSSVRAGRVWILNDLYVAEHARRNGAARALLDAAVAFARDDGAVRIVLETMPDNANARALYESSGWRGFDETLRYQIPL